MITMATVGMRGSGAHKAHEAHEALGLRVATIDTIGAGRSYGRTSPLSPALRAGERGRCAPLESQTVKYFTGMGHIHSNKVVRTQGALRALVTSQNHPERL